MVEKYLPTTWHAWGYTCLFNYQVRLAGTAGLRVDQLSHCESHVTLANRRNIQNHIGGLHACSMALAAESATGMVVGMNVPDSKIPLLQQMKINFVRRCQGNVTAHAWIQPADQERIWSQDKGNVLIPVHVHDESGQEPIQAELLWAWVPKQRKQQTTPTSTATTTTTTATSSSSSSANHNHTGTTADAA